MNPEQFGKVLAAHSEAMKKIDEFQATVNGLVAKQARDDTYVRIGSWIIGFLASAAMTLSGWALARASDITTLQAQRESDVATDMRQDASLAELDDDMAAVQQDISATRADVRNMSVLLRSQNTNLRALLEADEERPRRRQR